MARPRFLSRSREANAEQPKPVPVRRPAAGVLKRERRLLVKLREQRLRDLGGLLLEMYRRGTFREELLSEQCADLVAIETRLAEIDAALTTPRRHVPRCACGAPLLPGARFCPSCGRQLRPAVNGASAAADETVVVRGKDDE
jgi:hypothetical protein